MIKRSIPEDDITIINIYAPNIGAPQYIRQVLISLTGEMSSNTIIVGDFNIPLTQTLNDTIDQLELIDIYRIFHTKTMNFTFFSSAWNILQDRSHPGLQI